MDFNWIDLERSVLDQRFFLTECLSGEGDRGVFLADEDGRKVIARLVRSGGPPSSSGPQGGDEPHSDEHANLIQTLAQGDTVIGRRSYSYRVIESPEERLGDVLQERALTEDEAKTVLAAILPALQYLHDRRLVHGDLQPANVVAVGDQVKLTTDSLQRMEQDRVAAGKAVSAEIRRIGQLVREMMRVSSPDELPAGLRAVALASGRATESQWLTPAELLGVLRGEQPPRPEPSIVTESVPSNAAPLRATSSELPPVARLREPTLDKPRLGRKAVAVAAVGLVAVAAGALIRRGEWARAANKPEQSLAEERFEVKSHPAPSESTAERQAAAPLPADRAHEAAPSPASVAARAATPGLTGRQALATGTIRGAEGDWAVVAAIYRNFDAAARRAERLKKIWHGTAPTVFPREGEGRKYMVVLASGLSKQDAEKTRIDARAAGMPRDTYVTRLRFR